MDDILKINEIEIVALFNINKTLCDFAYLVRYNFCMLSSLKELHLQID